MPAARTASLWPPVLLGLVLLLGLTALVGSFAPLAACPRCRVVARFPRKLPSCEYCADAGRMTPLERWRARNELAPWTSALDKLGKPPRDLYDPGR
jgi:hypothetical protein